MRSDVAGYDESFYQNQREGSLRSAREIVPFVVDLVRPKSVIGIGCGLGTWLSVFKECGVDEILGVDGEYVHKDMLLIEENEFLAAELNKPLHIDKKFDLVVSLEVAEHIPRDCAWSFVDSLTRLGPVIMFSCAVPFQGGKGHKNENWPDYWLEHFENRGYQVVDCIRRKTWKNDRVEWWYAQNTLLFVESGYLRNHPVLERALKNTFVSQLSIVHPRMWLTMKDRELKSMPYKLYKTARKILWPVRIIRNGVKWLLKLRF